MTQRFGRYELVRPLGRGGMAEVFLARYVGPEGFEKRLVIKRILPKLADDQRLLRMFFEEARTHVSLSHGNLVSVFDFGRVENDYFIAMEHVRGADLERLLAACRVAKEPLPPAIAAYIGIELCRALAYVHRNGFVHRDVSPRNVLLSVDGEVKLSDFGLVLNGAREQAVGVRGTLAYASPEQARGERVDGRGDLYSLGCVLAEALSGARVREAKNDADALAIARAGAPLSIDGPLGAVIAKATQTAPGDRYAGADEMLIALEREAQALAVGREAAMRELAARVGKLVPASDPEPALAPAIATAPTAVAATYFRGNESVAVVDEILGGERRAWRSPIAIAVVVLMLAAGGVVALRLRAARVEELTPPPTSKAARVEPAPIESPVPATPSPSPPPSPPHAKLAAHKKSPPPPNATTSANATGTVRIQCSPWCIPFVDGVQRGPDRKNHTLALPAGRHVVEARRLDDRLERVVHVDAGQTSDVEFSFP